MGGRRVRAMYVIGAAMAPAVAGAQMLSVPVLQNAFSNPGITVAANFGSGSGASTYAAAGAWAPGNARLVYSGGIGALTPKAGGTDVTVGGRVSAQFVHLMDDAVGIGGFAGAGYARLTGDVNLLRVPFGASVGYRRLLFARAVSVYATPFVDYTRASSTGGVGSSSLFRIAGGVDVAVTPAIGVTLGYEGGAVAKVFKPGATGGILGVGVSYALRRAP